MDRGLNRRLSWQAQLARKNINILNINKLSKSEYDVFYEFMYHPYSGQTKWCKTVTRVDAHDPHSSVTGDDIGRVLSEEVLSLRKELEG